MVNVCSRETVGNNMRVKGVPVILPGGLGSDPAIQLDPTISPYRVNYITSAGRLHSLYKLTKKWGIFGFPPTDPPLVANPLGISYFVAMVTSNWQAPEWPIKRSQGGSEFVVRPLLVKTLTGWPDT